MKRTPIALPATYAEDAISRDLDIGEPTHWGKKQMCFNATDAELNEMLSDAEYYASEYPYMDSYCKPIGLSAKRAVVKIKKAKQMSKRKYVLYFDAAEFMKTGEVNITDYLTGDILTIEQAREIANGEDMTDCSASFWSLHRFDYDLEELRVYYNDD